MEILKNDIDADKFNLLIEEGIKQVPQWIEKEKASTRIAVSEESVRSLIKIFLSQNELLSSSAREPEGRVKFIQQSIYNGIFPVHQKKKRKR